MSPELFAAIIHNKDLREILKRCNSQEKAEFMKGFKKLTLEAFINILPRIDVNMHNDVNATILHYMFGTDNFIERVELLLQAGASLNVCLRRPNCGTLLHILLANEYFKQFYDVLGSAKHQHPIDFHLQDGEGKTLLLLATKVMAGEAVRRILALNTTCVDIPDNEGRTPLHIACALGQTWIVDQLLKAGANINARDHAGNTPVHFAAFNKAEVRQLLSSIHIDPKRDVHARFNAFDVDNVTAIPIPNKIANEYNLRLTTSPADELKDTSLGNITVCKKNTVPLRALLKTNFFNLSATEQAHVEGDLQRIAGKSIGKDCMEGHLAVMKMLVRYEADITQVNKAGDKPAAHCQDPDIKACLKEAAVDNTMFGSLFKFQKNITKDSNNLSAGASSRPGRSA